MPLHSPGRLGTQRYLPPLVFGIKGVYHHPWFLVTFCCCDKAWWPSQLREERVYLGLTVSEGQSLWQLCGDTHCSRQVDTRAVSSWVLSSCQQTPGREAQLGLWDSGNLKAGVLDIFPPMRPHLLILPTVLPTKTKHSNISLWEAS